VSIRYSNASNCLVVSVVWIATSFISSYPNKLLSIACLHLLKISFSLVSTSFYELLSVAGKVDGGILWD
jgi:hypothetical protein